MTYLLSGAPKSLSRRAGAAHPPALVTGSPTALVRDFEDGLRDVSRTSFRGDERHS